MERASDALAPRGIGGTPGREGAGPAERAHRELMRAQSILTELRCSLDPEGGGAVAANRDSLYGWCLARLVDANVAKDPSGLAPVRQVLGGLRDAWFTACC